MVSFKAGISQLFMLLPSYLDHPHNGSFLKAYCAFSASPRIQCSLFFFATMLYLVKEHYDSWPLFSFSAPLVLLIWPVVIVL